MRGACRQIALLWCVASLTTTRAALDPAPDDILPGDEGEGTAQPAPGTASPGPSGTTPLATTTTTVAGVPAPAPVIVEATCEGYCDVGQSPTGCFCDSNCAANGDCCVDQAVWCSVTTTTTVTLPLAVCSGGDDYDVAWDYETEQDMLTVIVGDTVTFTYSGTHTVYALASEEAYDSCDFTGALYVGGNVGNSPFEMCTGDFSPGTYYLACRIGSHCLYGQMKVKVRVAEIGPSLQAGLVEYFPEGNKTCSIGKNRISSSADQTLAECYAQCFDSSRCNFVMWQEHFDRRCTLYKDCSDRCDASNGVDCLATEDLLRELVGENGTTYAIASGYATCTMAGNDYLNDVFMNGENVSSYVEGDFYDDLVAKTLMFSHFQVNTTPHHRRRTTLLLWRVLCCCTCSQSSHRPTPADFRGARSSTTSHTYYNIDRLH